MNLPASFITHIRSAFKADGEKFLFDLPCLIEEASDRWGLTGIEVAQNLSYHFVALAEKAGQDVVLKIGVPHEELTSQIDALRLYEGRGACRLITSDADKGMLLLERLKPGGMLAELEDDEAATGIAAQVMLQLWRPAPPAGRFI